MPDARRILDPFITVFEGSMAKITIQLKKFKKLYLQALFSSKSCLFTVVQIPNQRNSYAVLMRECVNFALRY